MIESPYTVSNIIRFIAKYHQTNVAKHKIEYEKTAREILKSIEENSIFIKATSRFTLNGKEVSSYTSEHAAVTSKLIIRNLKLNARLRLPNRSEIVASLISSLRDGVPYKVYRYDIISFYESIDRARLYNLLEKNSLCSHKTLRLIKSLFEIFRHEGIKGLPRGLDISAYLSEIYLMEFDESIKKLSHVSFYARFVDDIVIITNNISDEDITPNVKSILSPELTLHDENEYQKHSHIFLEKCRDYSLSTTTFQPLNYLGYSLKIFNHYCSDSDFRSKRNIEVDISTNKVTKIKSRISSSLLSYCSSKKTETDYKLLLKRVKALTGNYEIHASGTNIKIKTGIYYNYFHKTQKPRCALKELDNSFKRILFSRSHPLFNKISHAISLQQRRELSKFSFFNGFHDKIYYSFSYQELNEIRKNWK
ncbi:antiviral reverse transcriptase Drt3a [Pseudomonas sp. IT-P294]|uniref:antiviral reverse transcriptase Drt3a n=1 Tax=Pseudomonas sp. IT-P294 TaxID=3026454 RepID=UPI0039E14669